MSLKRVFVVVLASGLAEGVVWAQGRGGGSEWLTAGGDAQRTSWIRTDAAISVQSMSKPGFDLQWKAALDNQARGSNGLAQGVTANGVTLFVPMSPSAARTTYAIDNDTVHRVVAHFDVPLPASTRRVREVTERLRASSRGAACGSRRTRGGGLGGGGRARYRGAVSEPGQVLMGLAQGSGGDGLALGALPEEAEKIARRAPLIALVSAAQVGTPSVGNGSAGTGSGKRCKTVILPFALTESSVFEPASAT
jgi:hypothetical protein